MMTSGALSAAWSQPDYYTLKSHGKPIGQISIERYPLNASLNGQNSARNSATVTEIRNTNHATREGTPFALNEISRFVEGPQDGQPLSFSYAYHLGEQQLVEASGQLQGNTLDISLQRENTISQGQTPIAPERFLFPDGEAMHRVFRQHFRDPKGSSFQFQTLALGLQPQLVNSEVIPGKRERLKLGHGLQQTVRQFEIKNPANPDSSVQEWRDAQGKLYKAKTAHGDELEMVLAAVDDQNWNQDWSPDGNQKRNQSWRPNSNPDEARLDSVDVVTASAVVSNKIGQPRTTTEALYRLSPIHGQSIDWASSVATNERQSIQKLTDNQLYLNVMQKEPKDASVEFPVAGPAAYLKSTPYVQSNDPEIDRLALDVVGKEKRAYFAARMLQQWVYGHISQKDLSLGFASAKETLLNREGDCTEHAVLLTALTRALGIPSRVAVGLIYLPNGDSQAGRFVYHMWTEIYLGNEDKGEWVPLDATRPEPLTDATHIKLADSALSNADDLVHLTQRVTDVMGRMKIDVLKALSPSQSVLDMDSAPDLTVTALKQMDLQEIDIQTLSRNAIQHFRVELPPAAMSRESTDGLFTYGVEALSKGRYEDAQTDFQQAIDKSRKPIALYRLGERLAGLEMYSLAQVAFQRAAEKDPRLSSLVNNWNSGFIPRQSLPDELNEQFMQAISAPGQESNAFLLKTVIAHAPDFAPALRRLGEESSGPEAIMALQRAVYLAPNDFRNHESLGDALMQQKRYNSAWQAYHAAIGTLKQNPAFIQSKPEWLMNLEGKQHLANGAQMIAQNKASSAGWLSLGEGLLQQKRREEAARAFSNVLALNPGNSAARILSFQMALQSTDWQAIYAHKDAIAGLARGNATAASILGLYQMRSRQYGPAVSSLQHAIAMAPAQGEAYRTLAQTYLRMADLADDRPGQQGASQSKRLIGLAQDTLRRGSHSASTAIERHSLALQLARLEVKSDKAADALQLANGVLAENPIDGAAWSTKGKAQYYLGQNTEARSTLETALILNPNDADTLVQLGHVAKEEERNALALEAYQKAYKADPLNQEASVAVRGMMTQLHIAGRQPPNYWFLSADEHDYLVQLLYQSRTLNKQTLSYLREMQALPGRAGRIEFSARGIAASQQLRASLEKLRQQSFQLAHSLQSNRVPARFGPLNQEMEGAVTKQLAALNEGINEASILDYSSPDVPTMAYAKLIFDVNAPLQSIQRLLTQLDSHLPDAVMDSLVSEAQLEDLPEINQEIASITRSLVSHKEKERTGSRGASPNGKAVKSLAGGVAGLPAPQGQPTRGGQMGQIGGMMPPGLNPAAMQNIPLPPSFSPNAIKNISLPAGLSPEAIKSFSRPATGP